MKIKESNKEGKMAKYDAKEIAQDAADVFKMIDETSDLPEWLEAKITIAAHNMNAVKDYLTHHQPNVSEAKKRDYKAEYKKYGSSKKAKKYRAELNAYNRKKGTYGNGDGKDASHKGGKIVGFEAESKNRGRREKSRLKKEDVHITLEELKLIIKEELTDITEDIGFRPDPDVGKNYYTAPKRDTSKGGSKYFYQKFSSPEARTIVDDGLRKYAKILRKAQYEIIKDWMKAAKAGVIDYFDLVRGFNTGDVSRAQPNEVKFLHSVLTKDKIVNRFRSYFGGKKGKNRR